MTSGSATAAASAARIALERSPVASEKLIRAAIYAEQQAAMQGELLSARARLERLIEARATVLAEKMYEERKRLDLEAVRQGMSDMSDPPGRRDDTPHPRW
jgi:hypothetical protein